MASESGCPGKVRQGPGPDCCQNPHWKQGGYHLIKLTTVPPFHNLTRENDLKHGKVVLGELNGVN